MENRDWIRLRGLQLDCVVGLYPHERDTAQPLCLDLELCLDTERAARRERLKYTIHYGAVLDQVRFLLTTCKFRLLETAAHTLCRYLLAPPAPDEGRPQIQQVRLRLDKPSVLGGHAIPSLQVERDAGWVTLDQEHKPFGTVDIIHETRDAGIYRLNIAPGHGIPLHMHKQMRESEMVLGAGLLCQGREVAPGTVHRWPLGAAHRYDNPTARYQSILCVDSPRFIEEDEIPVQGAPASVQPET